MFWKKARAILNHRKLTKLLAMWPDVVEVYDKYRPILDDGTMTFVECREALDAVMDVIAKVIKIMR